MSGKCVSFFYVGSHDREKRERCNAHDEGLYQQHRASRKLGSVLSASKLSTRITRAACS